MIERAEQVLAQAQYLAPRYSVVVTNPPYMGSGNMSGAVSAWIKDAYPDEKQDLYARFIIRSDELVPTGGFIALITGDTWMTNKVFEKLRRRLLTKHAFLSFVHMHDVSNHPDIFGANTAFVLAKDARPDAIGTFVYLDAANSEAKAQHLRKAVRHRDDDRVFSRAELAVRRGSWCAYCIRCLRARATCSRQSTPNCRSYRDPRGSDDR